MLIYFLMKSSATTSYESLFTIREVAAIFKLSPAAVRHLIQNGELEAIRIGKQFRVPQSVVDRYFSPFPSSRPLPGFGLFKGKKMPKGITFENKIRQKVNISDSFKK